MAYRLVAFDFDGTLADSFGWFVGVMGGVADWYGFRRIDAWDLEALRGFTARQMLAHLGLPGWKVPLVAAHVRQLQARDIDRIALFDGVADMLRRLAGHGIVLAVVSSNAEQNVRRVLGPNVAGLIRRYGCGASLFGKAAKLVAVARQCEVPPAEAIYVGDEVRDIEAARAAGMASGAVSWGYAAPAALLLASPTEMFDAPADVVRRLTAQSGGEPGSVGPASGPG
jgi:phosphoglycolate phosphatase